MIDVNNPVVSLCIAGTHAEFERRLDDAQAFYQKAWAIAGNDYEACIAAHYVARFQKTPEEQLAWNLEALNRANAADAGQVSSFYPSLYVNVGHCYELLSRFEEAEHYYALAAELGLRR